MTGKNWKIIFGLSALFPLLAFSQAQSEDPVLEALRKLEESLTRMERMRSGLDHRGAPLAEDVDEAMSPGFDLSAKSFNISVSFIEETWRSKRSVQDSVLDWNQLFQFNSLAAQIWESLVFCHNGNPELAREAYREVDDFCPQDEAKAQRLETKLRELHTNLELFMSSTKIGPTYFTSRFLRRPNAPTDFIGKIHYTKRVSDIQDFNAQEYVLPSLHPLFVQILMEIFISDYEIFDIDDEPDGEFVAYLLDPQGAGKNVDISSEDKNRAKRLINTLKLIDLFPVTGCEVWGLWPFGLAPMLKSMFDIDYLLDPRIFAVSVIKTKYFMACGDPEEGIGPTLYTQHKSRVSNSYHSRYADAVEDFVEAFRDLKEEYCDD